MKTTDDRAVTYCESIDQLFRWVETSPGIFEQRWLPMRRPWWKR